MLEGFGSIYILSEFTDCKYCIVPLVRADFFYMSMRLLRCRDCAKNKTKLNIKLKTC